MARSCGHSTQLPDSVKCGVFLGSFSGRTAARSYLIVTVIITVMCNIYIKRYKRSGQALRGPGG